MARTLTIHPASLAAGIVLAGVCFVSMSQATVSTPLRVEYLGHPRDMVQIQEGAPYTVPAGRVLALTAIGNGIGAGIGSLSINGVVEVACHTDVTVGNGTTMKLLPPGLVAHPGDVVTVADGTGAPDSARAWGYLVNQ